LDLLPSRVKAAAVQVRTRARAPQPRAERTAGSAGTEVAPLAAPRDGVHATVVVVEPATVDAGGQAVVLEVGGTVVVVVDVVVDVVVVVPTVPEGGPTDTLWVEPR
jgi:hypothetical protein